MKVREHISSLENSELLNLFREMAHYEKTGFVADDAHLRILARIYMDDNALAMQVVGYETWREMAYRWKEGEICQ